MLKFIFAWFDQHPGSYWWIAAIPTLVLFGWLTISARGEAKLNRSPWREPLFALLLFTVLLAWRWPFLLSADEYNPDESQLIAGAITFAVDPVPWRSVDGATSGPLNFYALLPLRCLGLPLDYFSARLTALLLIWSALLACYLLLRSRFGPAPARFGILPALAFFSTVTHSDLIHYSSEHLPIFLIAWSAFCLGRVPSNNSADERWALAGCFLAGMLPWTKLQSAPLAPALIFISGILLARDPIRSSREKLSAGAKRLLAAAAPTLLILAVVVASGQFDHFYRAYVLQNFTYVSQGSSTPASDLWRSGLGTGHFPLYLALSLLGTLATLALVFRSRRELTAFLPAGGLVLAATFCIFVPQRAFLHYALLTIVPLALWFGTGLGVCWAAGAGRSRLWLSAATLVLGGLVPFGFRTTQPVPEIFGSFSNHWSEPRTMLANLILRYASSQSRLAIWGWMPTLYVQTGLPQGTRDGNTYWAIVASQERDYFRQRFLSDLTRNQPALFVDAVGPESAFFFARDQDGHENFPPLAAYVRQHYRLVIDAGYARLYVLQGLEAKTSSSQSASHPETPTEHERVTELPIASMSPPNLPQWRMRTGFVQMMRPPAEISWSLDESTREIDVEYGVAIEAYRLGRSDGAELIFELHSKDVPARLLFHRLLDPVQRVSDRGTQRAHLILPPSSSGATLVARTTVGEAGNGVWDWIYLGKIIPIRLPQFSPAQFPHFNRVPDTAVADLSYSFKDNGDDFLLLHAPASLTYRLSGKERHLHFDYGFRAGAYTQGGRTDGATFQVELSRTGKTPVVLFQKQLAPTDRPEDRGVHTADFSLPAENADATLTIRVEPGPSNAWDWTYVTHFDLD